MSKENYVPLSLPSGCILYKGVEADQIKIRPLTGKDAQLIAELSMSNIKRKFIEIMDNVLKGVAPKDLTVGDAEHIMLWEAINSYEREQDLSIVCGGCTQNIDVTVDLGKIDSKELPSSFAQPVEKKISTGTIQLRLTTMEDEIAIHDFGKSGQSIYLYSLARAIVDEKTDIVEKMKQLEEMTVADINVIESFQSEFAHGPDMIATYNCPKCGYEGKLEVPFQLNLLFSFRSKS